MMLCDRCKKDFGETETIESYCGPQCPDCLAFLEPSPIRLLVLLHEIGVVLLVALALTIVCLLLNGCGGPPFTAGAALELGAGAGDAGEAGGGAPPSSSTGGASPQTAGGAAGAAIAGGMGGQNVQSSGGSSGSSSSNGDAGAGDVAPCALRGAATAFGAWTSGDGGPPSSAVDGDVATRWTSGAPQAAGQWFELDLQAPLELERLVLTSSRPSDLPATLVLELDGVRVPVTLTSSPGVLELEFAPHRASAVRLELEQPTTDWWSINELAAVCK